MSEKQLAIFGEREVTAKDSAFDAIDKYQDNAFDPRPPRLSIVKEVGQFRNVQTDEMFKELEGVIVAAKKIRAFFAEGDTKPICSSSGGVKGISRDESLVPGGFCVQCPLNAWGSDEKTGGKLCKERRRLLILTSKWEIPVLLSIPTTSITPFDEYATGLMSQKQRFYSVTTVLSLEKAESRGFPYYVVKFTRGRDLPQQAYLQITDLLEQYQPEVVAAVDESDVIDVS